MSVPRLITAAALIVFFTGNLVVMRSHFASTASDAAPAAVAPSSLPAPSVLLASSTVRQIRSEIATTNALLDRPAVDWRDDTPASGSALALRGAAGGGAQVLNRQVSSLFSELESQKATLSQRMQGLDGDLQSIVARAGRLVVPPPPPPPAALTLPPPPPRLPPPQTVVTRTTTITNKDPKASLPSSAIAPEAPAALMAAGLVPALGPETAVVMICFQRAEYLERALKAVKRAHPASVAVARGEVASGLATGPPILISQDGTHGGVSKVISEFKTSMSRELPSVAVVHLRHPQGRGETGYHLLAQHYKFALGNAFEHTGGQGPTPEAQKEAQRLGASQLARVTRVVVLEEDLEVSPDAFEFFAATAPLLEDPKENLLCVSAWNDNGQASHVSDPAAVYRSSFFPGLGWMLTREVWLELAPKWPKAYWDDWLREPPQQKGREVLRPEVCRTYHFATKGVSNNQFSSFLTDISPAKASPESVKWRTRDLSFLKRRAYDAGLRAELSAAPLVSVDDARKGNWQSAGPGAGAVRVDYGSARNFERVAQRLGIMDNVKAGCPRVAYHGVVTVRLGPDKRKVHVALPLQDVFKTLYA